MDFTTLDKCIDVTLTILICLCCYTITGIFFYLIKISNDDVLVIASIFFALVFGNVAVFATIKCLCMDIICTAHKQNKDKQNKVHPHPREQV